MAIFSQSQFLQALGWATLNSFWQMALLWVGFVAIQHFFAPSSNKKYALALASLALGFAWYAATFAVYYYNGAHGTLLASQHQLAPNSNTWSLILSSASLAYLLLLIFPAYRLLKNWQYVTRLRTRGLQKTGHEYRLFVKKVAYRLGIQKPVHVYISQLISSPVTIGYVKPIILLPVAALNSLTVQQAEAILLHELAHIKRSDFLINLIVTFLHTIFYYNPFLKKFVAVIEAEREKCCDEMVLQFEYDKISYASALLTLEKNAASAQALALGAAGKSHLLKRIEKIVGMEKKPSFSFTHFAGMMATLLLVIFINSLLFVSKQTEKNKDLSLVAFENPFYTIDRGDRVLTAPEQHLEIVEPPVHLASKPKETFKKTTITAEKEMAALEIMPALEPALEAPFMTVAYNAAEVAVTAEAKKHVATAVQATKKVLTNTQWKALEKEIADGMTEQEKLHAKDEYLKELEKIDWKGLEQKLKLNYQELDWQKINASLGQALVALELDSLHHTYAVILKQLEKAEAKAASKCATVLPVPDATQAEILAIKEQIRCRIDSINIIRNKKVISL